MKMLPLPLNFSNVWKKFRWSLKLMIFENDKSYRLEILIVNAQNKFVYAHGFNFNFFSTGIKFLKFFLIKLRVPNFTVWNSLPSSLRNITNFLQFKAHLKTHLFRQAFPNS